ncbi:MAG: hypothetical protein A2085_05705 [Gemmatimonadetes bacterium GWC2_71_10]|nr:MAG: hypothetical protein A2085_05705 [Gemmatimonadetes bacterium GWC2_71_10]
MHPGRALVVAVSLAALAACDALLTGAPDAGDLFDSPFPDLTPAELAAFVEGDRAFGQAFAPRDGLGPIFNNVSCASCHSGDGRGVLSNALTRFSLGTDPALDLGGPQLQDRAIPGAEPEVLPNGVDVTLRLPPPVFGVGLIEAIPDAAILANADSADADGDGISGRPNWVSPPEFVPATEPGGGADPRIGRFSRKAQVASILHQTVAAYHQDIGITSDFEPVENRNPRASVATEVADHVSDPEIGARTVRAVVNYLRMLAPPDPGPVTAARQRGSALFDSTGCAACHVPVLTTGPHAIAALANQPARLYSDLLLHDMGDGLADNRPDGGADGREWRTAPLWGLRLVGRFLNGQELYLHDGRARSLEAAVLLHGGEAQGARDRFAALGASDRAALLDFAGSR